MNITKWAVRAAITLIWIMIASDVVPLFPGLIDGEVWLTNSFADPLLFSFASGMLLAMLLMPGLWVDAAKAIRRMQPVLAKFLAMRFERPAAKPPHQEAEAFTPKLVASQDEVPVPAKPVEPLFVPPCDIEPVHEPVYEPIYDEAVEMPALEPEPLPSAFAPLPQETPAPTAAPAPKSAIPPQPSSLDLIMPNQVVQLAARYENWDTASSLKAWQIAWLWNDWEPVSDNLKGKPCLPAYLRLEAHMEAGALPARPGRNGWKDAEIGRQDLVDYALALGERPKFLFPEERSLLKRKLREWRQREIAPQDADGFATYSETKLELYKILQIINTEAVALEVKSAMRRGDCEGIARRQVGGVMYGFERIPRHVWAGLTIDWLGNVTGRSVTYTDLRVKFRPGYPEGAKSKHPAPPRQMRYAEEEETAVAARSRA